jgi:hypothetical protein
MADRNIEAKMFTTMLVQRLEEFRKQGGLDP